MGRAPCARGRRFIRRLNIRVVEHGRPAEATLRARSVGIQIASAYRQFVSIVRCHADLSAAVVLLAEAAR